MLDWGKEKYLNWLDDIAEEYEFEHAFLNDYDDAILQQEDFFHRDLNDMSKKQIQTAVAGVLRMLDKHGLSPLVEEV